MALLRLISPLHFPNEIRRAFTAQTVIDILSERDSHAIDNVIEAMDKLVADGITKVVVQPTHVMNGAEYDDMIAEITPYADKFEVMAVGTPLLTSYEDYEAVIAALLADNENAGSADTALVYMGHGTHHFANATYSQLEAMMHAEGYENAFVGTVELPHPGSRSVTGGCLRCEQDHPDAADGRCRRSCLQ